MALIKVDSDLVASDANQFVSYSDQVYALWNSLMSGLQLTPADVGSAGRLPDFFNQYSQAVAGLTNFLLGNDNPADPGGAGALLCFSRVLRATRDLCDTTADAASACVAKLG